MLHQKNRRSAKLRLKTVKKWGVLSIPIDISTVILDTRSCSTTADLTSAVSRLGHDPAHQFADCRLVAIRRVHLDPRAAEVQWIRPQRGIAFRLGE